MVSKHSKLAKRQARDGYGRFASPSSRIAPPPSCHKVGSSSRRCTTPPPSRMQGVGSSSCYRTALPPSSDSDDSVEMWVAAPSPTLRLQVAPPPPPPPPTFLVPPPPPPPTHVWECTHIKEVSSYEHYF
jgi:hypothetical protein